MGESTAPLRIQDAVLLNTRQLEHRDRLVASEMHSLLALAFVQEAALLHATQGHVPAPVPEPPMSAEDIHASTHCFIGTSQGDQLLGWVSLQPDDEPGQINLALLVVHPAHQRQGIGRSLVAHVLGQAEGVVFSVVCAASNAPALALYRVLGFAPYRRGSLGPTAIEVIKLRAHATAR